MTYLKAIKDFKESHKYLWDEHADYWKAEQAWAAYTDSLCKNGIITQRQFATWATPFPYGRQLGVQSVMYRH